MRTFLELLGSRVPNSQINFDPESFAPAVALTPVTPTGIVSSRMAFFADTFELFLIVIS